MTEATPIATRKAAVNAIRTVPSIRSTGRLSVFRPASHRSSRDVRRGRARAGSDSGDRTTTPERHIAAGLIDVPPGSRAADAGREPRRESRQEPRGVHYHDNPIRPVLAACAWPRTLTSDVRTGWKSRLAGLSAAGSPDSQTRAVCSLAASTQTCPCDSRRTARAGSHRIVPQAAPCSRWAAWDPDPSCPAAFNAETASGEGAHGPDRSRLAKCYHCSTNRQKRQSAEIGTDGSGRRVLLAVTALLSGDSKRSCGRA